MTEIRVAGADDAVEIAQILSDWAEETVWMPRLHTREEDLGFCRRLIETQTVFVVPGGFLAMEGHEVNALYLAPEARGKGHGKTLLDKAKEGQETLSLWTFQANTGARRFYLREGFREVLLTDGSGNDEKLPDVQMAWERG